MATEKGQVLTIENTNGLPVGKLDLNDGMTNFHFNGTGTDQIIVLIPPQYCNGGNCTLAQGTAIGTQDFQSSGNYSVSTLSNTPFSLTANQDGSFTVTQNAQIELNYTSERGTLIGFLQFSSVDGGQGSSTISGTFTATGGTFAPFFPEGGTEEITLGLTGSLQMLLNQHGFVSAEFSSAAVEPVAACMNDELKDSSFKASVNLPSGPSAHTK
jgi:hypothetical protein